MAAEQENPTTQRLVLGLHLLQGGAGPIQLAAHGGGGVGAQAGAGHGQGIGIGFVGGDQHHIQMAGAGVELLPGGIELGQGLAEGLRLGLGHPVEPQPLAAELGEGGEPKIAPGLQLLQAGIQGQQAIFCLTLGPAVGEGLADQAVEVEVGINAGLVAAAAHVAQVAQGPAGILHRMAAHKRLQIGLRFPQRNQVQAAQLLQPIDQAVLVGAQADHAHLAEGHDRHRGWVRCFLRLASLEFTTAARSASER
jgi:hypothetical protein